MIHLTHKNPSFPVAVILAGGESKRFGSPKALAKLNGEPLISVAVKVVRQAGFSPVICAASEEAFLFLHCPIICDAKSFQGPLLALRQIFLETDISKCLLLPCDMPFLSVEILQLLWTQSESKFVAALESGDGWKLPLPAVYAREILPTGELLIQEGKRDLKALLKADLPKVIIPFSEWTKKAGGAHQLANINSTTDLEAAEHSPLSSR